MAEREDIQRVTATLSFKDREDFDTLARMHNENIRGYLRHIILTHIEEARRHGQIQ